MVLTGTWDTTWVRVFNENTALCLKQGMGDKGKSEHTYVLGWKMGYYIGKNVFSGDTFSALGVLVLCFKGKSVNYDADEDSIALINMNVDRQP